MDVEEKKEETFSQIAVRYATENPSITIGIVILIIIICIYLFTNSGSKKKEKSENYEEGEKEILKMIDDINKSQNEV